MILATIVVRRSSLIKLSSVYIKWINLIYEAKLATLKLQLTTCNLILATYYELLATCNLQLATCNWQLATSNLQLATCYLQLAVSYLLLATIVVRRPILTKTNQSLKKLVSFPELGSAQPQLVFVIVIVIVVVLVIWESKVYS